MFLFPAAKPRQTRASAGFLSSAVFPARDEHQSASPCASIRRRSPIRRRRALKWPQARAVAAFAPITVLPVA